MICTVVICVCVVAFLWLLAWICYSNYMVMYWGRYLKRNTVPTDSLTLVESLKLLYALAIRVVRQLNVNVKD